MSLALLTILLNFFTKLLGFFQTQTNTETGAVPALDGSLGESWEPLEKYELPAEITGEYTVPSFSDSFFDVYSATGSVVGGLAAAAASTGGSGALVLLLLLLLSSSS